MERIRKKSQTNEHLCKLPLVTAPETVTSRSKCTRWYRKNIQIWSKSPCAIEKFRSEYDIESERQKQVSTNPGIIHPCSKFRTYYEFWMIFVLLISSTFYSFYAGFPTHDAKNKFHVDSLIYGLLTILNLFDVWMTFMTGYVEGDFEVICEQKKICRRYLCSFTFYFDVLIFIFSPVFEVITRNFLTDQRIIITEFLLLYIFKLVRLLKYVRRLCKFCGISERCTGLWECLVICFTVSHWIACIFILVPKYRYLYFSGDPPKTNFGSWLNRIHFTPQMSLVSMYINCLYRSFSHLLSVKRVRYFRKIRVWEESSVETIIYVGGRFFMGWITVLVLEIFLSISRKESEYQQTLTEITGYMRRKNVPGTMQERVIHYYEYKYNGTVFRETKILDSLSDMLVAQFHLYDIATLIKTVSFFEKLGAGTLERISKHLKCEVFLENDVIIKAGLPGDCMYFILHGTVAVLTPAGEEVCHLQDGGHFGEICLVLKDTLTNATVVAIERCTLYRLDRKVFKTCIKDKRIIDDIEQIARQRQAQVEELMATSTAAKFEMDTARQ